MSAYGCSEPALTHPHEPTSTARTTRLAYQDSVRQIRGPALTALTRAVALALQDNGLRQRFRQDLWQSRNTREHKLELNNYIRGNGGILLAKMSQRSGLKRDSLVRLFNVFDRALEIYLPVDQHRARWTGSDDMIVASSLREGLGVTGFRVNGEPVALDESHPPETPTVVIVPTETDFARPLSAEWTNADDAGGAAIGTWARGSSSAKTIGRMSNASAAVRPMIGPDPCAVIPAPPECQPPQTVYPPGLFLWSSHINDLGESWLRGDPEINVFLIGESFDGWDGPILSCSGNGYGDAPNPDIRKWFDQNGSDWNRYLWGPVQGMLFSEQNIADYHAIYTDSAAFSIQFWEDDEDACEIKGVDRGTLMETANDIRSAYGVISTGIRLIQTQPHTVFEWINSMSRTIRDAVTQGGDDTLLGFTEPQAFLGHNYPDATHILVRQHLFPNGQPTGVLEENGRVSLELRNPQQ